MSVTPEQAIAAAANQSANGPRLDKWLGEITYTGWCLKAVRTCYGVDPLYRSAADAWRGAKEPHPTTDPMSIPRGVPVYWTGGSSGFGHIAISAGDGYCWSTDILRPGYFDKVIISQIERSWGMPLVGWAEDVNGVIVWAEPIPEPLSRGARVDAAIKGLRGAARLATGRRLRKIQRALDILKSIPKQ